MGEGKGPTDGSRMGPLFFLGVALACVILALLTLRRLQGLQWTHFILCVALMAAGHGLLFMFVWSLADLWSGYFVFHAVPAVVQDIVGLLLRCFGFVLALPIALPLTSLAEMIERHYLLQVPDLTYGVFYCLNSLIVAVLLVGLLRRRLSH